MSERRTRRQAALSRVAYRRAKAALAPSARTPAKLELLHDPAAPALVLSPHWDDGALNCWWLLGAAAEVNVVNVFAGLPAPGRVGMWERVSGARDTRERAQRRIEEDVAALAIAGREPVNLPLLDLRARDRHDPLGPAEIDAALHAHVAAASHVYAPGAIGGHTDHLLVRDYGRLLLAGGMPVTLYAELPYCVFHGWPSWVDGREAEPDRDVDAHWLTYLRDVPELTSVRNGEVHRLDDAAAAGKRAAIDLYRMSLNFSVREMLAQPQYHRLEVSWSLTAGDSDTDRIPA